MREYHLLRVFVGRAGDGGNLLAVFLDGSNVPVLDRQSIATSLGYSETTFVDDRHGGRVEIYTPAAPLRFAGHPLVGTAWLLSETGGPVDTLQPPAGAVPTWRDGESTWIRGRPEWSPEFEFRHLASPSAVTEFLSDNAAGLLCVWSWEDEDAGIVRSRVFPKVFGIDEDEATGSAAIRLAAMLGRPIEIHQGAGSLLFARPAPGGSAEVGGRVALVDRRDFDRPLESRN